MQLIVDDLVQDMKFHEDNTRHHKLVVTGADPVPIEISEGGIVISRADLATSHEEADNIIVWSCVVPRKMKKAKSLLLPMTLTSLYCCCIIITWQISRMLY